jgi:hypothetical protein
MPVPFCEDGFEVETENNIGWVVGDLPKDQILRRAPGVRPGSGGATFFVL